MIILRHAVSRVLFAASLAGLMLSLSACDLLSPARSQPLVLTPSTIMIVGPAASVNASSSDLQAAADVIDKRLNAGGLVHFINVTNGQLKIDFGPESNAPIISRLATQPGEVVFFAADTAPDAGSAIPGDVTPVITNADIADAAAQQSQTGSNAWQVAVTLTPDGAKTLADFTSAHVGTYLVIARDGVVLSAPKVVSAITDGKCIIDGNLGQQESKILAVELIGGALPIELVVVSVAGATPTP